MNKKLYIHCYLFGWHCNSLRDDVSIYLNTIFHLRGTFTGGGVKVFWNIYISMIMQSSTENVFYIRIKVLHDYLLSCEIPTVRTLV